MRRAVVLTAVIVVWMAPGSFSQTGERQANPESSIAPRSVPAFAPTQPWRGKFLPDGQPELAPGIWGAVERLYRSRMHPAIQLCIRRHGEVILDRSIGHARGNSPGDSSDTPKVLATPDTPFNIFSASKAITATVIHLLDQQGYLHVDDPVTEYIP